MNFYNASTTPRPVRLSDDMRRFAELSLAGTYGREAQANRAVTLDDVADWDDLTLQQRYDIGVRRIAERAPIRITPYERIAGAATLGVSIRHRVPILREDKFVVDSVSHMTLGFDRALKYGINDYERRVNSRLGDADLTDKQRAVLWGIANVIDAMHIWHDRYMEALKTCDNPHAAQMRRHLTHVPFEPPRSFREAVQALWFLFCFERLMGNWPGIGRIDEMLGDFLERDLASGEITREEAREYLASFIVKGCEWITGDASVSGDAQHYQNLILGGLNAEGKDVCNEVTVLILEILEELPISDFPVALRLNKHTPAKVLQLVAANVRHGGGVMAVYNEDLVLKSLEDFGYPTEVARRFTNDGCWEVQIPGETNFRYDTFDAFRMLQVNVLHLDSDDPVHYDDYESLEAAWLAVMEAHIDRLHHNFDQLLAITLPEDGSAPPSPGRALWPSSAIDLLEEDCIGRAKRYWEGGPNYTLRCPHIGGFPDVVDSLYVFKKLVFEEKKVSFDDFIAILRRNWADAEDLRGYVRSHYVLFGNDSDEVDALAARLFGRYIDFCEKAKDQAGVIRAAGASTFGRQIEWAAGRYAIAHGFHAGTYLASNLCPTPDTDSEGVSAVIRSHCKLPLSRLPGGSALDIKLDAALLTEERYESLLVGLMKGFCDLGGFFMQMDVADNQVLLDAQKNPEAYRSLSVRVSGWSARFVTLSREWQDMIIERTTQGK